MQGRNDRVNRLALDWIAGRYRSSVHSLARSVGRAELRLVPISDTIRVVERVTLS
jgi:hypothetical protein